MLDTLEKTVHCPYCGEAIDILVDTSDPSPEYIEDCQVCCRPITMRIRMEHDEFHISVLQEDEY